MLRIAGDVARSRVYARDGVDPGVQFDRTRFLQQQQRPALICRIVRNANAGTVGKRWELLVLFRVDADWADPRTPNTYQLIAACTNLGGEKRTMLIAVGVNVACIERGVRLYVVAEGHNPDMQAVVAFGHLFDGFENLFVGSRRHTDLQNLLFRVCIQAACQDETGE